MKMPEPIGCGYVVKLEGASQTGFAHILGVDVYDKQAMRDLLEEAAEMCELFDATDPKYLAVEIRRMKETL
jgi:hypothetical protein